MPMWIRMERIKEWGKVDKWMRQLLAIFFFFLPVSRETGKRRKACSHQPDRVSILGSSTASQYHPRVPHVERVSRVLLKCFEMLLISAFQG